MASPLTPMCKASYYCPAVADLKRRLQPPSSSEEEEKKPEVQVFRFRLSVVFFPKDLSLLGSLNSAVASVGVPVQ